MPPHLFVATPCYGGVLGHRYLHGVLALMMEAAARGIPLQVETLARESLIPRARNRLAATFLAHRDATHLLFIDADIGFAPASVWRLLDASADIAAGLYPLKTLDWDAAAAARARAGELITTAPLRYVGKPCEGEALRKRDGFVTADYAGTGFMLIRRNVFERLAAAHPDLAYDASHESDRATAAHAFFDCMIDPETRHYLSEDYAFCRRWRALGGEIWLDTVSALSHTGVHEFCGNPVERFKDWPRLR